MGEVRKGKDSDLNMMRELLVQFQMASKEIEDYTEKHLNPEEKKFFRQLLPVNAQLVSEMDRSVPICAEDR